ncbi:cupin domain-containing protein [Candidatus Bathyarchaeota archaeon]|nr:MAG: cupin domain-containing protein [Candidatus Bathyarchaeota archaeon]
MKIFNWRDVKAEDPGEGSQDVTVRWLIDRKVGAKNFAMRLFEFKPGGYTPYHKHPWEHEVFVLDGDGVILGEGRENPISKGSVVYIPPNEPHQFRNTGEKTLRILCLIPILEKK